MAEVPSKSTMAADSRYPLDESAHPLERAEYALYSATEEIDDLTARTPCAWCTRSAFRVTTSLSSVRSLRFGRWHDRNEKIRSSPSRPVPVARSLFVSGFRNFALEILEPDKSRSRYRQRRETTRKKRMKRAFRFSTVFGVTKGYSGQRLRCGEFRKNYEGLSLSISFFHSSRKPP